jgi:hypothetical protein
VHPRIGGRRDRAGSPSTALLSPLDQEEYFTKNVNQTLERSLEARVGIEPSGRQWNLQVTDFTMSRVAGVSTLAANFVQTLYTADAGVEALECTHGYRQAIF